MEKIDSEELIKSAEEAKNKGNNAYKEGNFAEAVNFYTEAIKLNPSSPKSAIYYSNRALSNIRMDNYGLAINDADEAIKLDPSYAKAYYRKADANIALNKYEIASECLKKVVVDMKVKDNDAQEKYKFVKKVLRERAFSEAIKTEDDTLDFKIDLIPVEATYTGPTLDENVTVTPDWCVKLMDWQRDQKKLHKKYLLMLLLKVHDMLKSLPTLVEQSIPDEREFTVCGDTHGQYYDLLNIFKLNGNPSEENPYLFNGDFVDRGSFSVEVIVALLAWKVCNPNCMHLTRGNHEAKNMNKLYGFEGEVLAKYDNKMYELFSKIFCALPLCYVLNSKVMVAHGGLFSKDGVTLEDIKKVNRFREPPDEGIMTDLLWADPTKENGRHPSKRGISIGFGPDIAERFLNENKLELLVRSHEMKENGYEVEPGGRVVTIFSAPNYCDQMKNKGAFIRFKGKDMKPKYTTFSWVDHPNIPVMAYSRSLPFM